MINQLRVRIRPVLVPEIPPETTRLPPQLPGIPLLTRFLLTRISINRGSYNSNKIRKALNEHLIIVCQNLRYL